MLKIGTPVRYPGGTGTIDRTSTRTGVKLFRVSDKWFERAELMAIKLPVGMTPAEIADHTIAQYPNVTAHLARN